MEKMKKFAGELTQLAKIGEIIWFGGGCLVVLAALNVCFFEPNILSGEPVTLSLGSVKVDIWGADFLPPGLSKVNFLVRALMFCVLCFLVIYAAKIARKILLPMKEGLPFDESVYKNFRKLGVFTLIGGGLISAGRHEKKLCLLAFCRLRQKSGDVFVQGGEKFARREFPLFCCCKAGGPMLQYGWLSLIHI